MTTKPTQAQIEAAAKALHAQDDGTPEIWLNTDDGYKQSYRLDAKAALTAAAEIQHEPKIIYVVVRQTYDHNAAAEVGPITTEQLDVAQFGRVLHERPAAEVGEPMKWDRGVENRAYPKHTTITAAGVRRLRLTDDLTELPRQQLINEIYDLHADIAATIERCAQVADELEKEAINHNAYSMAHSIAAAIRKLKDEA